VHVFRVGTFAIGRLEVADETGERFWISDRERTVADVFRLRHLTGEDLAFAALHRYLQSRPRLARLRRAGPPAARVEHTVGGPAHTSVMTRPSRATASGHGCLDLQARARREGRPADELAVAARDRLLRLPQPRSRRWHEQELPPTWL
jgi:hypothetical protein